MLREEVCFLSGHTKSMQFKKKKLTDHLAITNLFGRIREGVEKRRFVTSP
jgi:hypothetical protein